MPIQNHKDALLTFINSIIKVQLKRFTNELYDLEMKFTEKKQSIACMQNTLHGLPHVLPPMLVENAIAITAAYDTVANVTDKMYTSIMSAIHKCATYKAIFKKAVADCAGASASELASIHAVVNTTQIELERLHALYLVDVAQYTADITISEAVLLRVSL